METSTFLEKFEQQMIAKGYSLNTIKNYGSCVRLFLEAHRSKASPKRISSDVILEYLLQFKTNNTRKHNHSALKVFYKRVVHQPLKFRFIPYPKKQRTLPRVIDRDEILKALCQIENLKHKTILSLAYCCGLRVSEVVNIRLKDFDDGILLIRQGKGNKDRYVSYSEAVKKLLYQYAKAYHPKEYLFNGINSLRYSVKSCQEIFKKYVDVGKSFRSLRHGCFTAMLENGTDMRTIQTVAGHSSITTTMIYTHVSRSFLKGINTPI